MSLIFGYRVSKERINPMLPSRNMQIWPKSIFQIFNLGLRFSFCLLFISIICFRCSGQEGGSRMTYENSIGMKMLLIKAGTFKMGTTNPSFESWSENPAHDVSISRPFSISQTEVTIEQFQQFKPGFTGSMSAGDYAVGISWYEAVAFCEWLSQKEGKPYRLPTEAEWEYTARAGTTTSFWSGTHPPDQNVSNPWGLKNVHSGPLEWCWDWYGPYTWIKQKDPVGVQSGMARVVRGGGLDQDEAYYARSANRAGMAPGFKLMPGASLDRKSGMRHREPALKADTRKGSSRTMRQGLSGTFYDTPNLRTPKKTMVIEKLEHRWNEERTVKSSTWSGKWGGFLIAPVTGEVTFHVAADYGATLEIQDESVVHWFGAEGNESGGFQMVKGKAYPVCVMYYHNLGKAFMNIQWSWTGQEKTAIPAESLFFTGESEQAYNKIFVLSKIPGAHSIGFRIVQAPMPDTKPLPESVPFTRQCVVQKNDWLKKGPDPNRPWYRKRAMLPMPPDNELNRNAIRAAGLNPGIMGHNHSPALEVCPNGDLLMVIYTSEHEFEPEVSLLASRLRFGADQWDMPEILFDFPDVNDHAPLLWTDADVLHAIWGNPRLSSAYPFQWTTSKDNGATWGEVRFPVFKGPIGPHSRQPVNTMLRDARNRLFVPGDGEGGSSILWATTDNGETWYDTGGRSGGRHTSYVILKNGNILGMGGKDTEIDGYMTKSISTDAGKTWKVTKTPFSTLGSNQRPSVLRLHSGRLFFTGDFQRRDGHKPIGIKESGAYVALSEDEGITWHIKKLAGAQLHEEDLRTETVGYTAARQAPNGIIHLITSMNTPCLHFELNEAWILSDAGILEPEAPQVNDIRVFEEKYPDGRLKGKWQAGIGSDGRILLHGKQEWYHENGQKQWEVTYGAGKKAGEESLWDPDGRLLWSWSHPESGIGTWTQYWSNGRKKAESGWKDFKAQGLATTWDPSGKRLSAVSFHDGRIK